MLVVSHAFSRKNAGDGLLVDLTLDLLAQAGIPRERCRVLALDAASFADLPNVRQVPGEPRAKPSLALARAGVELLAGAGHALGLGSGGEVARLIEGARGVVAVGGGYLVTDSVVRSGGVAANHLAQILAAGRAPIPTVYLPQSIGPLLGPVGALTRRALSKIDVVYARDDVTHAELRGITDVRRCADLAVLRLAERLDDVPRRPGDPTGPMIFVPRDLPRAPGYHERLRELGRRLDAPLWAVQADVDGPRSDRRFIGRLGERDAGNLATLLRRERPGVVVSVRLHGAIESLLAGWPAVHLSYERKGWGAYEDLGLDAWVHDARRFDPAKVAAQAEALRADPSPMFDRIAERAPRLRASQDALVAELAQRFGAGD